MTIPQEAVATGSYWRDRAEVAEKAAHLLQAEIETFLRRADAAEAKLAEVTKERDEAQAEIAAIQHEQNELWSAIIEGAPDNILRHQSFVEMVRTLHAARKGAKELAEAAEAEVASLKAERDGLQENIWALEGKIKALSPHETCACSWDKAGDLCEHHSPKLAAAEASLAKIADPSTVAGMHEQDRTDRLQEIARAWLQKQEGNG